MLPESFSLEEEDVVRWFVRESYRSTPLIWRKNRKSSCTHVGGRLISSTACFSDGQRPYEGEGLAIGGVPPRLEQPPPMRPPLFPPFLQFPQNIEALIMTFSIDFSMTSNKCRHNFFIFKFSHILINNSTEHWRFVNDLSPSIFPGAANEATISSSPIFIKFSSKAFRPFITIIVLKLDKSVSIRYFVRNLNQLYFSNQLSTLPLRPIYQLYNLHVWKGRKLF